MKYIVIFMLCASNIAFAQNKKQQNISMAAGFFKKAASVDIGYNSNFTNNFGYYVGLNTSLFEAQHIPADFDCRVFDKIDAVAQIQSMALYNLMPQQNNYVVLGAGPTLCNFALNTYEINQKSGWFENKYNAYYQYQNKLGLQTQAKYVFVLTDNITSSIGFGALFTSVKNIYVIKASIDIGNN